MSRWVYGWVSECTIHTVLVLSILCLSLSLSLSLSLVWLSPYVTLKLLFSYKPITVCTLLSSNTKPYAAPLYCYNVLSEGARHGEQQLSCVEREPVCVSRLGYVDGCVAVLLREGPG